MDVRHLQYVAEIAKRNSFTKAAEALHLTQPTVSKMIKNLEAELNVEVFAREGKQIRLTEAGEAILRHAGPILHLFDNLLEELRDISYLHKGTLLIGLPPMAGAFFFPRVIKRFGERYPGITIRLAEEGARVVEDRMAEGTLDAGVLMRPFDEETFDSFPIVEDRLKVVLHPSHRLADRENIELAELADEPFILFSDDFALHDRIIGECRSAGFSPRIVHESSQWDFIGELAGEGLGVALLPETICRNFKPERVRSVRLVRPAIPWSLAMAWRKEGYLSLAAKEWIRFTKEMFAGSPHV